MTEEAKRLVKALRNSYGYSERRDQEAADMIESLSTRLEYTQGLFDFEKEQLDKVFNVINIWKHRAEAAERDLHSIIRQADDGCNLCRHYQPCMGKDCPKYISGKGATDEGGMEYPNFPWTCEEFDFGTCPLLENTPCNGCDFENHWEWRGPCEENGGPHVPD